MKVKNLFIVCLVISIFASALLCTGCNSSEQSGDDGNQENVQYENIIKKVYATQKRTALVFTSAKNNSLKKEVNSFLSERGVSFSYVSDKKGKLIYEYDKKEYVIEPTVRISLKEIQEKGNMGKIAEETPWGSVICVDMSSISSEEQAISLISDVLDAYNNVGYEFLTPEALLASDENPHYVNDLDILNYPNLTTPIPFGVEGSNPVDYSYFDDAVFIGDSITQKLQMYVSMMRSRDSSYMGKAKFLCSASLGASNSLSAVTNKSLHPSYNGVKQPLWDSVAQMGAKKVYIMLGVNDLTWASYEKTISNLRKLISKIREAVPSASIYIQSVTPRVSSSQSIPNNQQIFEFNLELVKMCREDGYYFIDTAYALRDENGNLPDEFCSDLNSMGMHFTNSACEVWVDYLRTHTP